MKVPSAPGESDISQDKIKNKDGPGAEACEFCRASKLLRLLMSEPERQALHRITCLGFLDPQSLEIVSAVGRRLGLASRSGLS